MARVEFLARALMRRGDRVLVCRDLEHGHAYLPGGHVEFGEAGAAAAARELQEECGLACEVGAPLLVWESRFVQRGKPKHEFSVVFHVEPSGGGVWPAEVSSLEDHIAFEWIDPASAPDEGVVPRDIAAWLAAPVAEGVDWVSIEESD